jgi:hypothetical protein
VINGFKVTVGVNNGFDELAPSAPQAFTEAYADVSTYGAIGRLIFVSAAWWF